MFIKNIKGLKIPIYSCNMIVGDYLIKEKSMPLLSIENSRYLFAETDLLKEVLEKMPFYLKILKNL